jgi:hypothetical protein
MEKSCWEKISEYCDKIDESCKKIKEDCKRLIIFLKEKEKQ